VRSENYEHGLEFRLIKLGLSPCKLFSYCNNINYDKALGPSPEGDVLNYVSCIILTILIFVFLFNTNLYLLQISSHFLSLKILLAIWTFSKNQFLNQKLF